MAESTNSKKTVYVFAIQQFGLFEMGKKSHTTAIIIKKHLFKIYRPFLFSILKIFLFLGILLFENSHCKCICKHADLSNDKY